jgi:hypothetical protein
MDGASLYMYGGMSPLLGTDALGLRWKEGDPKIDPPGHNLRPTSLRWDDTLRFQDGKSMTVDTWDTVNRHASNRRGLGGVYGSGDVAFDNVIGCNQHEHSRASGEVVKVARDVGEGMKMAVTVASPLAGLAYAASEGDIEGMAAAAVLPFARVVLKGGVVVQFGKVANQVEHAFRHVDKIGLGRLLVRNRVVAHLETVVDQLQPGVVKNFIINIEGKSIQYSAYRLPDGTINVGRIHEVVP